MRLRICAVVCVALAAMATSALAKDVITGTWKVTLTPDEAAQKAGEKASEDTLVFKGDKLTSAFFAKRGFAESAYDADTRGMGAATFTATSTSDKQGALAWTGSVLADQIEGTVTWTKKDGTVLKFEFKGGK